MSGFLASELQEKCVLGTVLNPSDYCLQVTDNEKPVRFLNELEFVKGEVWANVWQTECIARINHKTGAVR